MIPEDTEGHLQRLRDQLAHAESELARFRDGQCGWDEWFLVLAEAAPFMVWMAGRDGQWNYVNTAWLRFRGRCLAEEMGGGWTNGVHPDDRPLFLETYERCLAVRQSFRISFRLEQAGGEFRWVECTGSPIHGPAAVFRGYVGSAHELSVSRQVPDACDESVARMVLSLTERERQVLVLIAGGCSTRATAARLGISYKTADSHRSRILEKFGVHETASLVRYAIRAGLIEP